MYDKEMYERACLSPFLSFFSNDIIEKEIIDGFKHRVRSIIVEPYQVPLLNQVKKQYGNGYTRTGMTISYPFGGLSTETKVELIKYAIVNELDEVDIGININAVLSGDWERFKSEMELLVKTADGKLNIAPVSWVVKVPFETVDKICQIYIEVGLKSVKTNPGLHFGDMKVEHVKYLCDHFGDKLEVEVAGRCRTREKAEAMKAAGAAYFHLSQWRRICGGGQDYQFDFEKKTGAYGEYKDRS